MSLVRRIAKLFKPQFRHRVKMLLFRNDLNKLAVACYTDKWDSHWYTQHYQRYFAPLKNASIKLLEIGVGGYSDSDSGGESLRMWKAFFPKAQIVGIDIADKTKFRESRVDIRICDQTDANALVNLSNEFGGFDIIIDDGSHVSDHVIQTFHILFPILKENGIYAIEDTQTSYWPDWGGGLHKKDNHTNFFKGLTDGLNYTEYPLRNYEPTYFDLNIVEMAFFHNLIIIRKGKNNEAASSRNGLEKAIRATESQSHLTA